MITRFRLPYTHQQVYDMLYQACRVEVSLRHRSFNASQQYQKMLLDIAQWLTSDESTFGLFLCGGAGNGKTTILLALQNLINFLRSDEPLSKRIFPMPGFMIVSAKHLVEMAKAFNNPSRDNDALVAKFKQARDIEILAIDDLGTEPRESMHYGDFVMAATDILTHRYDMQLCTLVTSNLAPADIASYYDERIADRFREMMHIINFGAEQSFRKPTNKL